MNKCLIRAVTPDSGTACNGTASADDGVLTNDAVMRYLYLIVDLHTLLDNGVIQSPAVNCGTSTYLDIIADAHASQLCNFHGTTPVKGESEAVCADDNGRMQYHSIADGYIVIDRDIGIQNTITSNPGSRTNIRPCPDDTARADHDIGFDHNICADTDI